MKPTALDKLKNKLESEIGEALLTFKGGDVVTAANRIAEAIIETIRHIELNPELVQHDQNSK